MKQVFELPGFQLALPSSALGLLKEKNERAALFSNAHIAFQKKRSDESVGFYDWPEKMTQQESKAIQETAQAIRREFEAVLLVGIGGSYLGAACLMDALCALRGDEKPLIHWISNVDRTAISSVEKSLRGKKTAVVLISKSGSTTETLSVLYECHTLFDLQNIYVVTDPSKGELRHLATQWGWKAFPVPENIGGRYSVFTAVGLFPLEIAGIDTSPLVEGAKAARRFLEAKMPEDNPAYLYAYATFFWTQILHRPMHIFMPYESALARVGDWFVQLWAESIGKKRRTDGSSVGFTPIRCLGTTDQHSQLQLFKEGPKDKAIGFLDLAPSREKPIPQSALVSNTFRFLTRHSIEAINREACLAVEKSLERSEIPTYRFTFPSLNAKTLGSFLFFQMTACAFAGELFEVNAFDQPGVEEAKELLRNALSS